MLVTQRQGLGVPGPYPVHLLAFHPHSSFPRRACPVLRYEAGIEEPSAQRPRYPYAPAARRADCSVFFSSIAMVIGPTPPGTGVIADATSDTGPKSTSPVSR